MNTRAYANERTFLAWMRSSVALLGFGFVIAKFDLVLAQMGRPGHALSGGLAVTGSGALLALLATARYLIGRRAPEREGAWSLALPLLSAFLVMALAAYLGVELMHSFP